MQNHENWSFLHFSNLFSSETVISFGWHTYYFHFSWLDVMITLNTIGTWWAKLTFEQSWKTCRMQNMCTTATAHDDDVVDESSAMHSSSFICMCDGYTCIMIIKAAPQYTWLGNQAKCDVLKIIIIFIHFCVHRRTHSSSSVHSDVSSFSSAPHFVSYL